MYIIINENTSTYKSWDTGTPDPCPPGLEPNSILRTAAACNKYAGFCDNKHQGRTQGGAAGLQPPKPSKAEIRKQIS